MTFSQQFSKDLSDKDSQKDPVTKDRIKEVCVRNISTPYPDVSDKGLMVRKLISLLNEKIEIIINNKKNNREFCMQDSGILYLNEYLDPTSKGYALAKHKYIKEKRLAIKYDH